MFSDHGHWFSVCRVEPVSRARLPLNVLSLVSHTQRLALEGFCFVFNVVCVDVETRFFFLFDSLSRAQPLSALGAPVPSASVSSIAVKTEVLVTEVQEVKEKTHRLMCF